MTITSRFASECLTCGETIHKGESIEWANGKPARHVRCAPAPASQEDYPCSDRGYEDQCARACGYNEY